MRTMTSGPTPRRRIRLALAALVLVLPLSFGCSGLLQNLGAKWVTRQIAAEFNLDEAQTVATRASVDRLITAAPAALSSKVDMLVATVDAAIAKGFTEEALLGMERQVDKIVDIIAAAIIDEASPILATLRDDQIDFAEARINERLEEAREEIDKPKEERLEKRQDAFVNAVEDWADDITDEQEAILRRFIAALPDEGALRLRADEERLERIGTLMRKHPGSEAIRDALWQEWKDRERWGLESRTPAERRAEGRKAILYVYGLFDAEQKERKRAPPRAPRQGEVVFGRRRLLDERP
ncbi:MAG: hypothetical protein AMJ63_18100 [Myxococcales bacterium SG8_38_1]|nr:MAG: hypothetical protein AMJ63_18100 [Myxococcales bacterium SG8_38_1]